MAGTNENSARAGEVVRPDTTTGVDDDTTTPIDPDEVGELATVGPAIGRLSVGLGNVAGSLLDGSGIAWHDH